MKTLSENLQDSKNERIRLFLERIESKFNLFKDTVIGGTLCKIPKTNQIPNKRYYQFKIRMPIGYETTTKYRIRINNVIYDLYKRDNNYYLIDIPKQYNLTKSLVDDFCCTIQFSFCYYMITKILEEITEHTTVKLQDYLFTGLLDRFNDPQGQLEVILTKTSVKNKVFENNKLYISLFN